MRLSPLPLRHKRATAILSYEFIVAHLFRLALKLIISTKGIQIQLNTVRLAGPAKLTQSKKSIGVEVVNLDIKLLKYFT